VTTLPDYLAPAVQANVQAAQAASNVPYTPYTGQQVAGFNTNQQTQQANVMALQAPNTQYNQSIGTSNKIAGGSWTDPGVAASFMNPYQQNVTDIAKREATRQSDIQGVSSDAQFAKAGAYGGSRQGVVDAERQRNLATQQNDIQTQGANQAYNAGQAQYNTQNQAQLAGAQQGAALAGQQQGANLGVLSAQGTTGLQQQQLQQQMDTQAQTNFINQTDYAKQQANFMSGIIHGTPVTANSNVQTFNAQPNQASQLAGLGIAGLGAYNAATATPTK